ncbi:double-stranded RNA-binding protein 7-like [Bidens hawaiensis]|uniref:double-stranded RNA-binding protein 7-like n=1 Tax=Bidens hawaiensis TaxID=980011 RepID=UPI004049DF52
MEEQQQSVSSCFVFKSRLQEYAQKAGLKTPIYHTIKEGPSHQPVFRSTVVINEESYHSLTGFLNRKAAEQSAAEVALIEIAKTGATDKSVSHPVHETGLCKNLLQEYAQKMNYAIPLYVCTKDENKGRDSLFSCTVDIGGIKYIGTSAKTKKEAELKAAKTALLAIKMSTPEPNGEPDTPDLGPVYTVVPTKRKEPERAVVETVENGKSNKRKKGKYKKRKRKVDTKRGEVVVVKTEVDDDLRPNEERKVDTKQGEVVQVKTEAVDDLKPNEEKVDTRRGEVDDDLKPNEKRKVERKREVVPVKTEVDDDLKPNKEKVDTRKGEIVEVKMEVDDDLKPNEENGFGTCENTGFILE